MHGFGFAGALAEVGLPSRAIPVALLFFNVGVEIGQLLFVAGVLGLIARSDEEFRKPGRVGLKPCRRTPSVLSRCSGSSNASRRSSLRDLYGNALSGLDSN